MLSIQNISLVTTDQASILQYITRIMFFIRDPIILEDLLSVTVLTLAECYLWKVSLGTEDDNKNVDDEDNLVLLDDIAGDVSGDRDKLV